MISKWNVTTDPMVLRRVGKLSEELAELSAVAARIVIQGIDEIDPSSQLPNRQRLIDEIADVLAQCECTISALALPRLDILHRQARKMSLMVEWEGMFEPKQYAVPGRDYTSPVPPLAPGDPRSVRILHAPPPPLSGPDDVPTEFDCTGRMPL